MQLTEHFSEEELLNSNTATAKGITEQYTPSDAVLYNLTVLCEKILEPLRIKLGKPITISSGYRCERLNQAVGGMGTSQHLCNGGSAAVDTTVAGMEINDWYEFVKNSGIPTDEIIIEHDSEGHFWVHISYDNEKEEQRGICLIGKKLDGGGTETVSDGLASFKNNA